MKKKHIISSFLLLTLVNIGFANAKEPSCTLTSEDNVAMVTGINADGENYKFKDHCYNGRLLFKYSCEGNLYKKQNVMCKIGCDRNKRACIEAQNPSEASGVGYSIPQIGKIFKYDTSAYKFLSLYDYYSLEYQILILRDFLYDDKPGFDGHQYDNDNDYLNKIRSQAENILKIKKDIYSKLTHGIINNEITVKDGKYYFQMVL